MEIAREGGNAMLGFVSRRYRSYFDNACCAPRSAAAPGASLPPGPASPNLGRNATHGDEDHERNL